MSEKNHSLSLLEERLAEQRAVGKQELHRPVQTITSMPDDPDFNRAIRRTTVWDKDKRELVQVNGDEAQQGLAEGRYLPDRLSGYRMVDDQGQTKFVDGTEVQHALDKGWHIPSMGEAANARRKEDYKFKAKDGGLLNAVGLGISQVADQMAFGIPERVLGTNPLIQDKEYLDVLKEEYPTANVLGNVAGVGASMVTGAPLFSAGSKLGAKAAAEATKKIGLKSSTGIVGSGIKGAVEGAVASAPITISEAALGDPDEAAENLLLSLGIGAVIPSAIRGIQTVGRSATRKATELGAKLHPEAGLDLSKNADDAFRDFTDVQAARSHGIEDLSEATKKNLDALGGSKAYGKFVKETGLVPAVGEKPDDLLIKLDKIKKQSRDDINNVIQQADNSINVRRLPKVNDVQAKLQESIESVPVDQRKQVAEFINSLKPSLEATEVGVKVTGDGKKLADMRYGLASLQKARNQVDDALAAGSPGALSDIRSVLEDAIQGTMAKADESVSEAYQAVKNRMKMSQLADDVLKGASARAAKKQAGSLQSVLNAGVIGELVFDSFGAGLGLTTAKKLAKKFLWDNFNRIAAVSEVGGASAARDQAMDQLSKRWGGKVGLGLADAAVNVVKDSVSKAPFKAFGQTGAGRVVPSIPRVVLNQWGARSDDPSKAVEEVQENLIRQRQQLQNEQGEWIELISDGAPGVAGKFAEKQLATMDWLINQAPRRPEGLLPSQPWKATPQQAREYAMKLDVASNPRAILAHVKRGTLQPQHVAAMEVLYPKYLESVRKAMAMHANDPNTKLNRVQRNAYSTLMGSKSTLNKPNPAATAEIMGWTEEEPQQQAQNKPVKFTTGTNGLSETDRANNSQFGLGA
jgi:hypothetical protein